MLTETDFPVLGVSDQALLRAGGIRRVLVIVDRQGCSNYVLELLRQIGGGAEVLTLQVPSRLQVGRELAGTGSLIVEPEMPDAVAPMKGSALRLAGMERTVVVRPPGTSLAEAIAQVAHYCKADLIVIGSRHLREECQALLQCSDTPVVITSRGTSTSACRPEPTRRHSARSLAGTHTWNRIGVPVATDRSGSAACKAGTKPMRDHQVGALMVVEGDELVGIPR